jgi:hypothetical protein
MTVTATDMAITRLFIDPAYCNSRCGFGLRSRTRMSLGNPQNARVYDYSSVRVSPIIVSDVGGAAGRSVTHPLSARLSLNIRFG